MRYVLPSPLVKIIRSLGDTGFFHIVGAGTINKAASTILSIVLVRLLSKYDYGIYSFAFNIASYFIIFNGLGATTAALQLCCEQFNNAENRDAIYRYAYQVSIAIGILFLLLILLTAAFFPLSIPKAAPLLALYCTYPMLQQLCDVKTVWFRVQMNNKAYALATNVQTILLCFFSVAGAFLFGAAGLAVGQSIALLVTFVWLCFRYPKSWSEGRLSLALTKVKDFWGIALISAFNSGISQALTLLGTTLVASLTASEVAVSDYRVASTVPFALLFFPSAVATYVYPYFVRHKGDRSWLLKSYGLIIGGSACLMGAITLFFIVFAEPVVTLVFGGQYLEAVPVFRVLMIGFFLTASVRTPTGNLLVTQRKLAANTWIGIILLVACFMTSQVLIPSMGIMGAALSYDICMAVGSFLASAAFLKTVLKS